MFAAAKKRLHRVVVLNHGWVYEVYAKSISQGSLFGFVDVKGVIFGEKVSVIVAPSEETLPREFSGGEWAHISCTHGCSYR